MIKPRILEISSGLVHPVLNARRELHGILESAGIVTRVPHVNHVVRVDLGSFDIVFCYYHEKRVLFDALDILIKAVEAGTGLVALHSAAASFKNEARYHSLLGGRFIGHGKTGMIRLRPQEPSDSNFSSARCFTVYDEPYQHEIRDVTIRYVAEMESGDEPFVWTREMGAGRVAYCALGHTARSLRHPGTRSVVLECVTWVGKAM